jgi:hypothetical protein
MPNTSSAFALGSDDRHCVAPLKRCILPPGARPLCFATTGTTDPNSDQFCGYIQNGLVYSAKGCCSPVCPSVDCPGVPPAPPTGVVPPGVERSPELIREQERNPTLTKEQSKPMTVSRFAQLILLLLAILVVSALILAL